MQEAGGTKHTGVPVKTLKKLLKKAGLKVSGKKATLTRRAKKAKLFGGGLNMGQMLGKHGVLPQDKQDVYNAEKARGIAKINNKRAVDSATEAQNQSIQEQAAKEGLVLDGKPPSPVADALHNVFVGSVPRGKGKKSRKSVKTKH